MRFPPLAVIAAAVIAFAPRARAADAEQEGKPSQPDPASGAYLSFSPIHLTRPIGEITGEMKLGTRSGVAVVMGLGTIGGQAYWNVGSQLLFYPIGRFERGVQLGIELSYAGFAGGVAPGPLVGPVNTVAVSPLVGYKWMFAGGFTLSTQAGASFAAAGPDDRRFSALYNLNVGWSF